ncbi:MAG: M50 family metallopeptidase [Armatimonadetes bacterium]|nr:M50 family metallopeptidase [Armatimonadota bacterium]
MKRRIDPVLAASLVLALLTLCVPFVRVVLLPVEFLNTLVHEFCHATMAVLTGGHVIGVSIESDTSGLTLTQGGISFLISIAGYLGASGLGSAILASSHKPSAKWWLGGLAVSIGLGSVMWMKWSLLSIGLVILWVALLGYAASQPWAGAAATFVGVQLAFNAVRSAVDLINLSRFVPSDALNASKATFLPPVVHSLVWAGLSILWAGLALRARAKSQA